MSAGAASPADILRAVERWARSQTPDIVDPLLDQTGWWNGHNGADLLLTCPWSVQVDGGMVLIHAGSKNVRPGRIVEEWRLSPAIALAWALLLETGSEPVDVGRCDDCVLRGGAWEYTEWPLRPPNGPSGFEWEYVHKTASGEHLYRRPCPACTGTSRETIPAERLLLDAASGDATARDLLLVRADELQAAADPTGDLLAWALRLWTGEPTVDAGECPACKGKAWLPERTANVWADVPQFACMTCDGTGRQFGHPHTAEAVAWLG